MFIESIYEPEKNSLSLRYTADAQNVLVQAAKGADLVLGQKDFLLLIRRMNSDWMGNFTEGAEILARMAGAPSGQIRLTAEEAQNGLHIACLSGLYFLDHRLPSQVYEEAIVLLAGVTPVPIGKVALPPAAEVLDRLAVPPLIWDTFEALRSWPYPSSPHGLLIPLHQLNLTLAQLPHRSRQVDQLRCELAQATAFFTYTIRCLAMAQVATGRKSGKKGKKK